MPSIVTSFDFVDRKILRALLSKGRSTFAELAAQTGLTAPTVHDRVKKLERWGIIQSYTAVVNPALLGYQITAMVSITTSATVSSWEYESRLAEISEIQECLSIAGEETYMVRVLTKDPRSLEHVLQRIRGLDGTTSIKTAVVLSSPIRRHNLPQEEEVQEVAGEQPVLA